MIINWFNKTGLKHLNIREICQNHNKLEAISRLTIFFASDETFNASITMKKSSYFTLHVKFMKTF